MKKGRTLVDLALELERQKAAKRDFIADTSTVAMKGAQAQALEVSGEDFTVNGHAHRQIATRLGIPYKYYEKMQGEAPALLAENVNTWFRVSPERRMIRTMDGIARAFLSDRYRRIDNDTVAETALPIISEMQGATIEACEITDRKLYIKVVNPRLELEVKKGDPVQAGLIITNSEVGMGALSVYPLIYRLVCLNGMVRQDDGVRRYHVGRAGSSEEEAYELYQDDTLQADDAALLLKLRDTVRTAIDATKFKLLVDRFRDAADQKLTGNPVKAVEVLAQRVVLGKDEKSSVLRHLIEGGDLSRWGVANAVTRAAADVDSFDRSIEMEAAGGQVIDLSPKDWSAIAEAA